MTQDDKLMSVEAAAAQLKVSKDYVHQLVRKGRLTWMEENRLDVAQVEKLSQLMNKLRQDGIATLVEIAGNERPKK